MITRCILLRLSISGSFLFLLSTLGLEAFQRRSPFLLVDFTHLVSYADWFSVGLGPVPDSFHDMLT